MARGGWVWVAEQQRIVPKDEYYARKYSKREATQAKKAAMMGAGAYKSVHQERKVVPRESRWKRRYARNDEMRTKSSMSVLR